VLPLLSSTDPDVPDDAAFDVDTVTEPVVLLELPPATIDTEPPVFPAAVVVPVLNSRDPEVPVEPTLAVDTVSAPEEEPFALLPPITVTAPPT